MPMPLEASSTATKSAVPSSARARRCESTPLPAPTSRTSGSSPGPPLDLAFRSAWPTCRASDATSSLLSNSWMAPSTLSASEGAPKKTAGALCARWGCRALRIASSTAAVPIRCRPKTVAAAARSLQPGAAARRRRAPRAASQ
eukprot:2588838-Prymnesium_polylepis.1